MLETIHSPEDLKKIAEKDLAGLCEELRVYISEVVHANGGHLASNLGAVELTVAQHRIFNSPTDKIIFDVGHQSYTHKILTGRYEQFRTIRKFGGISGFPKHLESPHDAFDTGHSSTSISAALGMAAARDLLGQDHQIIANIGDGALTGGMALEALNHEGHIGKKIIIVLNDNEMSISDPVGAIANQLTKISSNSHYRSMKYKLTEKLVRTGTGRRVRRLLSRGKSTLKYMFSAKGMFFEHFGLTYLGPYDGHDIIGLEEAFKIAKNISSPCLVHVITTKGKGDESAMEDPEKYHGVTPSGGKKAKSFTSVFGSHLLKRAQEDRKITAITAAMCTGTGLDLFREQLPERFFDVSIAEQHGLTFAAGQAISGLHPVIAIYATFMQRGADQVIHDICMQNLPVTMILDRAGLVGEDGETHHGVFDICLFGAIPNLLFMEPKDGPELERMLDFALSHNGPSMIRFPKGAIEDSPCAEVLDLADGGMEQLIQAEGARLAIVALGSEERMGRWLADRLQEKGIASDLYNPRFINPIAPASLKRLEGYDRVVTLENHVAAGGFGSLLKSGLQKARVSSFGLPNEFIGHGTVGQLREQVGFTKEQILKELEGILGV